MEQNKNALTDKELEQVVGGMSDIDVAYNQGTVAGHLYNALNDAKRVGHVSLIGKIGDLIELNREKRFAEVVSAVENITAGVYDSTCPEVYASLKSARQTILDTGLLEVSL